MDEILMTLKFVYELKGKKGSVKLMNNEKDTVELKLFMVIR